jgi:sulfocyanin
MRFTMQVPHGRRLAGGLALGAVLLGSTSAAVATTRPATTPTWVTTQGKLVHLTVIAGWNNMNAGFNFNGAAHGQMVVTVPLGDKVVATFKNNVAVFHDVDIIPYTTPLPSHSVTPAFPGSCSPLPSFRPRPGGPPPSSNKPQTFAFVASKPGTYMIICGVPGHALAGMWDTFVVSRTARVASVSFK